MMYFLRTFLRDEAGSPLVEFAIVAVFAASALLGTINIAEYIRARTALEAGVRAGFQFASKYPTNTSGVKDAVALASNLAASDISTTTSSFCECNGITTSCSSSCEQGYTKAYFTTITLSYSMDDAAALAFAMPSAVSRTMTIRTQ